MKTRSIRHRLNESTNIWPGFVDVLATLLIVIIFVLMVFTVSQIYLSDAISGRDKALEDLRNQIDSLSKILVIESKERQQALEDLSKTESELLSEQELTLQLESQIVEDQTTISTQSLNIALLSGQIGELLTELKIVETMHLRKKLMYDLSDAFTILPGGLGTLDEAIEIINWANLGLHRKSIILLDVDGYWSLFCNLLSNCDAEGFSDIEHRKLYTVLDDPERVIEALG